MYIVCIYSYKYIQRSKYVFYMVIFSNNIIFFGCFDNNNTHTHIHVRLPKIDFIYSLPLWRGKYIIKSVLYDCIGIPFLQDRYLSGLEINSHLVWSILFLYFNIDRQLILFIVFGKIFCSIYRYDIVFIFLNKNTCTRGITM